jgi:hypothetical protein
MKILDVIVQPGVNQGVFVIFAVLRTAKITKTP